MPIAGVNLTSLDSRVRMGVYGGAARECLVVDRLPTAARSSLQTRMDTASLTRFVSILCRTDTLYRMIARRSIGRLSAVGKYQAHQLATRHRISSELMHYFSDCCEIDV